MLLKRFAANIIGEVNLGRVDYLLRRKKDPWGPLNGQTFRRQVYSDILSRIPFRAIVETGTGLGTTTEYFSTCGLPVYSVEIRPRAYGFAAQRLSRQRDRVHLFHNDSRKFLDDLAHNSDFPKSRVFFYLDAHAQGWSELPPVIAEIETIFINWTEAVVMVDDFQVPGADYGFLDCGSGSSLSIECLHGLKYLRLVAFFPTVDPKLETGIVRGWVVLCREDTITQILSGIMNLKRSDG